MLLRRVAPLALLLSLSCASSAQLPESHLSDQEWASIERYEKGGAMVAPKMVKRVEPRLTQSLLHRGSAASARVEAAISADGRILDVRYVDGDLEWAAVLGQALRQSTYTPAMRDGQPVACRFQFAATARVTRVVPIG